MKGLIGAATVMGSLMYGAGHCWHGTINMNADPRSRTVQVTTSLLALDHTDVPGGTMAQRRYPPVALRMCR